MESVPPSRRTAWRVPLLIGAALVAVTALLGPAMLPPAGAGAPPRARLVGAGDRTLAPLSMVQPGAPVRLEIDAPQPLYVHVVGLAMPRGAVARFPSQFLLTDVGLPVPAGRRRLPGRHGDRELSWPLPDEPGAETFLVVAAVEPQPSLAAAMADLRQVGNAAFPDRPMSLYAPRDGGMERVVPRGSLPHELLRAALAAPDTDGHGPMLPCPGRDGVWLRKVQLLVQGDVPPDLGPPAGPR